MIIPVSLLSAFGYCKRKVFLERVLGIFEPARPSFALGSFRHAVFDRINKAEEGLVRSLRLGMKKGQVLSIYKRCYVAIVRELAGLRKKRLEEAGADAGKAFESAWEIAMAEAKERSANTYSFMRESGLEGAELWKSLTPKISSEVSVASPKLRLRGVVDRLMIYRNKIIPVEIKTGKSQGGRAWKSHLIQIAAYMLILGDSWEGSDVSKGVVRYVDEKKSVDVAMNPFLREEVLRTRDSVLKLLSSAEIPPKVKNLNKCRSCGIREQCYEDSFVSRKAALVTGQHKDS